jgi:hypothetical protein
MNFEVLYRGFWARTWRAPGGWASAYVGSAGDVQAVRRSASACPSPSIPRKSGGAKRCAADPGLPQARSGDAPELCAIPSLQRIMSSVVVSRTKCADSICSAHAALRPGHTGIYFVETSKAAGDYLIVSTRLVVSVSSFASGSNDEHYDTRGCHTNNFLHHAATRHVVATVTPIPDRYVVA